MTFTDASTSAKALDYPDMPGSSTGTFGDCLADYSPKDKPWDVHKAQSDRIACIYASDSEFKSLGARVWACAGELLFAWVDLPDSLPSLRLRAARFCRVRNCPVCQWRRSMMWQARFYEALPAVQEAFPRHRWVFLTLTVKNCLVGELRATLGAMSVAWKRFCLRPEFQVVSGWVRTTEVTKGANASAHPHYHCLLLVPPSYFGRCYVTQARWAELWRSCARLDYSPIVDVRAVRGDLTKAVQETLKYSVKPSDMQTDEQWFLEYTRQVHKMRFVATGGALKGVLKPEEEITDRDMVVLNQDEESQLEEGSKLRFGWDRPVSRYRSS
jgi:hypothetical protein